MIYINLGSIQLIADVMQNIASNRAQSQNFDKLCKQKDSNYKNNFYSNQNRKVAVLNLVSMICEWLNVDFFFIWLYG